MTGGRKTSTPRVHLSRQRRKAGKIRVVLWLDEPEARALEQARILRDWNSTAENSDAVAAFVRMNLSRLLKR